VLLQPELLVRLRLRDGQHGQRRSRTPRFPGGGIALAGKFFRAEGRRSTDPGQEQLLWHATVEELVRQTWRYGERR